MKLKKNHLGFLMIALCAFMLFFPGAGSAQEDKLVENFQYTAEGKVTPGDNPFFILEINPSLLKNMQPSLKDFRIFSGSYELGYAPLSLRTTEETRGEVSVRQEVINEGFSQEGLYSLTVVTKDRSWRNDQMLMVKLEREPYLVKGNLYGSNDNRNWQKLQAVTLFGIEGQFSGISLQGIDYDYLKIDFEPPSLETLKIKESLLITPVQGDKEEIPWKERVPFETTQEEAQKETWLVIDLDHENHPSNGWQLSTREQGFYRQMVTEGSNDKENWDIIGITYIFRGLETGDENLSYQYPPGNYRYLRLRILDGDNEPVKVDEISVITPPVKLLVKVPHPAGESMLEFSAYWGNEYITSPSYDVIQFVDEVDPQKLPEISLGQGRENPRYNPTGPPMPFSERYPALLSLGLGAAAAALALIFYRNLKQVK